MALIVEDGTGLANAESLTSVAFFRDYHTKRGNDVSVISDTIIEQLLRKATDYFEAMYGDVLQSVKLFAAQMLSFPRLAWPGPAPVIIQQAVAELAFIAKSTPLMPTATRGKRRVKVGPLEVEYDDNSPTKNKFVAASLRVAPYLSTLSNGPFATLIRT